MTVEQWLPIPGYEGRYEVSDQGRARSLDRHVTRPGGVQAKWHGRVLNPRDDNTGRPVIFLYTDGKCRVMRLHRAVIEAFRGPAPDGMECCHNDGDCHNNRLDNLRWDTRSQNLRDSVRHGTHVNASKTHCPVGHPYSGDNLDLDVRRDGQTSRRCRTCHRKSERERWHTHGKAARAARAAVAGPTC